VWETITVTGNTRVCQYCTEPLTGRQRLYCSNRCTVAAHRLRNYRFPDSDPIECEWCFEPIYFPRPGQRWCSAKCKQAGWRDGLADETSATRARNAAAFVRIAELAADLRRETITATGNTHHVDEIGSKAAEHLNAAHATLRAAARRMSPTGSHRLTQAEHRAFMIRFGKTDGA
jgi:hypothetical protein